MPGYFFNVDTLVRILAAEIGQECQRLVVSASIVMDMNIVSLNLTSSLVDVFTVCLPILQKYFNVPFTICIWQSRISHFLLHIFTTVSTTLPGKDYLNMLLLLYIYKYLSRESQLDKCIIFSLFFFFY